MSLPLVLDLAAGKKTALRVVETFPSCPIPENARRGRTLRKWRAEFLAYFDTACSSNGGAEAINGLIELHRRIARGFRNKGQQPATHASAEASPLDPRAGPKSPETAPSATSHPFRGLEPSANFQELAKKP